MAQRTVQPVMQPAPMVAQALGEPAAMPAPVMPMPLMSAPLMPVAPEPAAVMPDVIVQPAAPRPAAFFAAPIVEEPKRLVEEASMQQAFIPPAPERAAIRPQRMPTMEELPRPAQAMLQANRDEAVLAPPAPEHKRMTLMQRLAAVGLGGRREEEVSAPRQVAEPMLAPESVEQAAGPSATHEMYARRPVAAQPQAPVYRPAQGNLDPQGRIAAPTRGLEDDQLEIPAFLRRQVK
jgi:cell division protein FtsZ